MIKNSGNFKGAGLKALEARIRALGKKKVVVGVPASKNSRNEESSVSNTVVAAAQEFGVPGHIPERSFLRSTLRENKESAVKFLASKLKEAIVSGDGLNTPFELLGEKMAGEVKRKIQSGISPPLAPETITRKGSSKPLIDTGQLLQSITYEVRDDG
ncbi:MULTISPECIES: phage virion morphogenesis protein [Photorhabdus]|uniref:Phage protein n=2 Tax=Photorhabdus asymbiotica TaxID=291112 RepID=C7BL04_PHOAA|nr:hypothetical protein [Photorhabdus asymbiotica]RKS59542.1 hypothetical protein BDD30_1618 [Photorhabdus asymbiotica]CAQ85199.1 conserved hypothetical protein [Photorhabdus asymbiotica]CAQ85679.1 conserved hypothetical protein [Photorhabdus asymbiotica]